MKPINFSGGKILKFLFVNGPPIIKHGLSAGLAEAGADVAIIEVPGNIEKNPRYLKEGILSHRPDFIFVEGTAILKPYQILFPVLREFNIPLIFWAIDDPPEFNNFSLHLARRAKHVFTTAVECIPAYREQGIQAHQLQFACLPSFHKKAAPEENLYHDIIFIGNNYHKYTPRATGLETVLKPLLESHNIRIYGNQWWVDGKRPFTLDRRLYGGYLPYARLPAAYSSAKIVLGLHSVDTSPSMMSMRTFEALGCGAFHLTQWTPAIENYFSNHRHLVWSKSSGETLELVKYYLGRDDLRGKIAGAGQAEVYAKHTYLHRARDLLAAIQV
jgi:spore maturation protein CgeB